MRVFIAVLVLIFSFQSWTKADDIRDFEIEGMSIGDSLLDYFSEEEIKKNYAVQQYPNNEFIRLEFLNLPNLEYDGLELMIKSNDDNYIIYSVGGFIDFPKNFERCIEKKKELENTFSSLFKESNVEKGKAKHRSDDSGKSIYYQTQYQLNLGGVISVTCYDFSVVMENDDWVDNLMFTVFSKEAMEFIYDRAFK